MRWYALAIAFTIASGCGRDAPPGMFVGESAHFRLFVDPALGAQSLAWGQENGLAALETEWSDVETMLKMPDGKITFYWLTYDAVPGACGTGEGACTLERSLEIDSPIIPNAHELTHAYMYLRKQRHPIPFVAEGMAESIDCGLNEPETVDIIPWAGVVASEETSDSLAQGGAFMRYLIRRFGIDAVLRYYEQAPERRDPALFAANFESFWGVTMDDAWGDTHEPPSAPASFHGAAKICPCSLPPLVPGGALVKDSARAPYWTLPDTTGTTLALAGANLDQIRLFDCAGFQPPVEGSVVLARLDGTARRYVLPPVADAEVGDFLADDCASAAPYTLAANFGLISGVLVALPSRPTRLATVFLQLVNASPRSYNGPGEICATCAFDQGACQPSTGPTPLQGTTFARVMFYTTFGTSYLDLDTLGLKIH